jgi:hypothetical protein
VWRSKPDSEPYDCSYPQETARDLKKQYLPIILVFLLIFVSGCASGGFNSSGVGPNQQFLESCEGTDFGALASASKEQVPREAGTGIVPYNEIRNIELFKHQIPVGDDLVRAISEICPGVLLVTFNQGRSYIYEENSDKLFQFAQLEIPQSFVAAENDFVNFFNTPQRRIDLGLRDVIVNDNKLFLVLLNSIKLEIAYLIAYIVLILILKILLITIYKKSMNQLLVCLQLKVRLLREF